MAFVSKYIQYLGKAAEKSIEKKVASFLPKGKNLVYLDLGCGGGEKTLARAHFMQTKNVLGIEGDPKNTLQAAKKGIKIYKTDLNQKWPIKACSVDCITATEVIEHLIDLDNFFSESKRVLKDCGTIIISTENLAGYHNIFALLLGNQPYTGPYLSKIYPIGHRPHAKFYNEAQKFPHVNVMTIKSLEDLLKKYGFKIKKVEGVSFYPLPPLLVQAFTYIDKYHSSYCVVVGEKS